MDNDVLELIIEAKEKAMKETFVAKPTDKGAEFVHFTPKSVLKLIQEGKHWTISVKPEKKA